MHYHFLMHMVTGTIFLKKKLIPVVTFLIPLELNSNITEIVIIYPKN